MTNAGQISGHGIFRSGGRTNNGSVTFTGGSITVNGAYVSDPADNFFNDIVLDATGYVVGDGFFVSGDVLSSSAAAVSWETHPAGATDGPNADFAHLPKVDRDGSPLGARASDDTAFVSGRVAPRGTRAPDTAQTGTTKNVA